MDRNRPLQQWLAQFDLSDLKDWIVPLLIVGGSALGSITKAIRERAEKKKNQAKKALEPSAQPARPANRDIPVARARPGSMRGPLDRSSSAPPTAHPQPSMRRTARPLPPALQPHQAAPSSPSPPVARRMPDATERPRPATKASWDVLTGRGQAPVRPKQRNAGHEPGKASPPTPPPPAPMPSTVASRTPDRVPKQPRKRPSKRSTGTARVVHPIQADRAEKHDDPFAVSLPSSDPHALTSVTPGDISDRALIRRPTRAALRRAIIMNEILAPPIALREPDDRA